MTLLRSVQQPVKPKEVSMSRRFTLHAAVSAAILCTTGLLARPLGAADDSKVVGTWKWSFTGQDGTTRNRELRIKSEGGKLSAVTLREGGQESPVKEIKLEGDTLKVSYSTERNGQTFDVEYEGAWADPWGGTRIAFSGKTEIEREDWGVSWNVALEAGGWLVSKKVQIEVDLEAVHKVAAPA